MLYNRAYHGKLPMLQSLVTRIANTGALQSNLLATHRYTNCSAYIQHIESALSNVCILDRNHEIRTRSLV